MLIPRPLLTAGVVCLLIGVAENSSEAAPQSVTYVGKQTTTDFTGYGQHLQYWPLFGRTSPQTARRTDDEDCIEITPDFSDFKHHYLPEGRTFSNDALGSPIGTKTRGGYADWPTFTLPDGTTGLSGTFYDESNVDNSNNTVNGMKINTSALTEFCLNIITDNTNGQHNADVRLEARSDDVNVDLGGHPDLTFDGQTDMYSFRYEGMQEDDYVKIRFQCSSASGCKGAGLGGIMISDISTCATSEGLADAGPGDPDAGAVLPGGPDAGATGGEGEEEEEDESVASGCQASGQRGGGLESIFLIFLASLTLRRRRRS